MRILLFVAVGGAIGSAGRYLIGLWLRDLPGIPWETFFVNVVGSFALGFIAGFVAVRPMADPAVRMGLTVGLLGGFTTFSTFTVESLELVGAGHPAAAIGNLVGSVVAGLIAAGLGLTAGRAVALLGLAPT